MANPAERILANIALTWQLRCRKTITCAPDVEEWVRANSVERPDPWDFLVMEGDVRRLVSLMGFEVHVHPDYQPGQWKMTKHDHCQVIDQGPDAATAERYIVSHEQCTVMDEEPAPIIAV